MIQHFHQVLSSSKSCVFACRYANHRFFFTASSPADDIGMTPVAHHFKDGSKQIGILAGYGVGFRMGSKADRESSRELAGVRLVEFIPRIGVGITDRLGQV